jgi:hypothetical protein
MHPTRDSFDLGAANFGEGSPPKHLLDMSTIEFALSTDRFCLFGVPLRHPVSPLTRRKIGLDQFVERSNLPDLSIGLGAALDLGWVLPSLHLTALCLRAQAGIRNASGGIGPELEARLAAIWQPIAEEPGSAAGVSDPNDQPWLLSVRYLEPFSRFSSC